jgi:hypothetical protein
VLLLTAQSTKVCCGPIASVTEAKIRNAKPTPKRYKLADGQGLYVEVMPAGTKFLRIKYRI